MVKSKLQKDKTIYPTEEELVTINKAVLGSQKALDQLPEPIRQEIIKINAWCKPRPKERIPEILEALKELWEIEANADMRLGQLLLNFPFRQIDKRDETSIQLYAMEDDQTLQLIKDAIKKCKEEAASIR